MHLKNSLPCCLLVLAAGMFATALCHGDDVFEKDVRPILLSHCVRCHGPEAQEGNLRLDTLSLDLINERAALEHWHEVLNAINAAEMPPADEPQLPPDDLKKLTDWVSRAIKHAVDARRQTDGRVVLRRLNRVEYQHTMFDLLGLEMDYVRDLPPDAVSADGFQNDGRSLQMSALLLEYYLATARRALDRVIVVGEAPMKYDHVFEESKIDGWLGDAQRSNRLGRQQEFLAKMAKDYPDDGEFSVRVKLTADIKPNTGYPLLEVSVGYRPDTEILMQEFDLVEIKTPGEHEFEFRGRLENFPLPVRGQGKYPGLVVRVRNVYDDQSPKPAAQKDEKKQTFYAEEPHLSTLTLTSVEFHGQAYDQWPPALHRRILFEPSNGETLADDGYVTEVLRRFMTRAFRRPVAQADVEKMLRFYRTIRDEFPSAEEAMRETLAMVLIQPEFLFLIEPASDQKRPLDDWEFASRLSYFLWSTMPDERLSELAAAGKLREPAELVKEVERMIGDPMAQRFVNQFTDQWLGLNVIDNIAISKEAHSGFDESLKRDMCDESRQFFAELLRQNLSAINLLASDFTMLNERLARHYGVPAVYGNEFQRVALSPDSHRGGVLTQSSILLCNSTGADSHPVRRAVWIRDRLLNDPPAPPPPNVPTLEDGNPEFHKLSIREQLELHRSNEACNSCHKNIDPWGIALENFDAVGRWRTEINRKHGSKELVPIDAKETLPGGQEVDGVDGLRTYLVAERRGDFARSLVSRLLTYALGRSLEIADQPDVEEICADFAQDDYRLKGLIQRLVASKPFQTK